MGTIRRNHLTSVCIVAALVLLLGSLGSAAATYHGGTSSDPQTACDDEERSRYDPTAAERAFADARGFGEVAVDIADFQPFDPASLVVDAGACVEWTNVGSFYHEVYILASTNQSASSTLVGGMGSGGSVGLVLDEPGTYHIVCSVNHLHEATMHQVVEVV